MFNPPNPHPAQYFGTIVMNYCLCDPVCLQNVCVQVCVRALLHIRFSFHLTLDLWQMV